MTCYTRILASLTIALCSFNQAQAASISHGKQIFQKVSCAQCHVDGGNVFMPNKPIKGEQFAKDFPDDAIIVRVIRSGIKNSSMPAFGKEKISDADMIDLVAYIRSLTPKK